MDTGLMDFLVRSMEHVGAHPRAESSLHMDAHPDIGPWVFAIMANTAAGRDFVAKNPWILDATFWFIHNYLSRRLKRLPLINGGDSDASHASVVALRSIIQVIEQLGHPEAVLDLNAKKPTESLFKKVLMSFKGNCKDCTVENCLYASHLEDIIRKAADLAESFGNYITGNPKRLIENDSNHMDPISLREEDTEDHWIKVTGFQMRSGVVHLVLNGEFDLASRMKDRFKDVDDDLVGLDADLKEIKDQIIGPLSELQVIPVVGMGGIGKTTLAIRVYKYPQIIYNFHRLEWTTLSQEFQERDVLLELLLSIAPLTEEESKQCNEDLVVQLYRWLKGQKYFIVVDDIWTTESWDTMKRWFPNDQNGSRILLTSRLEKVACHANLGKHPHCVNFLDSEDSWTLLCKKVFAK